MTTPQLPDYCWPITTDCCTDWDNYSPEVQQRAEALAVSTLRALTGNRVGGCPVTVRPCRQTCWEPILHEAPAGYYGMYAPGPVNWNGTWVNMVCGCGAKDCSCTTVCEVVLPPPVGYVESVQIGTQVIPPTWYRVDNGDRLVWLGDGTDTECGWPLCQDMTKPAGQEDTFTVTYLNNVPVDGLGSYAAGVLACEFAKACSGQKCRLPSGVVALTRQGVSMTVVGTSFRDNRTGLIEVDAWLRSVNPGALVAPSRVWYPDMTGQRVTTWSK